MGPRSFTWSDLVRKSCSLIFKQEVDSGHMCGLLSVRPPLASWSLFTKCSLLIHSYSHPGSCGFVACHLPVLPMAWSVLDFSEGSLLAVLLYFLLFHGLFLKNVVEGVEASHRPSALGAHCLVSLFLPTS